MEKKINKLAVRENYNKNEEKKVKERQTVKVRGIGLFSVNISMTCCISVAAARLIKCLFC